MERNRKRNGKRKWLPRRSRGIGGSRSAAAVAMAGATAGTDAQWAARMGVPIRGVHLGRIVASWRKHGRRKRVAGVSPSVPGRSVLQMARGSKT